MVRYVLHMLYVIIDHIGKNLKKLNFKNMLQTLPILFTYYAVNLHGNL